VTRGGDVRYVSDDYDGGQPTAYGLAKEIGGALEEEGFDVEVHSNASTVWVTRSGRTFRIRIDRERGRERAA